VSGCVFHPRCRYAKDICKTEEPPLNEVTPNHYVACHLATELTLEGIAPTLPTGD
jgi:peptide/nickel transport system ATP-binding protein